MTRLAAAAPDMDADGTLGDKEVVEGAPRAAQCEFRFDPTQAGAQQQRARPLLHDLEVEQARLLFENRAERKRKHADPARGGGADMQRVFDG